MVAVAQINIVNMLDDISEGAATLPLSDSEIRKIIQASLTAANFTHDCGLAVIVMDDTEIQTLNRNYRHRDKATNVLSFPQYSLEELEGVDAIPELELGDIFISLETVTREAAEQGKSPRDHFTHMLVHGTLHLLGFNHIDNEEAETMEALEISILKGFAITNPYD